MTTWDPAEDESFYIVMWFKIKIEKRHKGGSSSEKLQLLNCSVVQERFHRPSSNFVEEELKIRH